MAVIKGTTGGDTLVGTSANDLLIGDMRTLKVVLVSTDVNGVQGNYGSHGPIFSPDGTKIAFNSSADSLVNGDTNNTTDIFIKDLVTGTVTRLSTNVSGAQGNDLSSSPVFSPDGSKIAFYSYANNLVSGDTNNTNEVFVKDLVTGAVTRVQTSASGLQGNGISTGASFSPDGTRIAFNSTANNLVSGDSNGTLDIFVKNLVTGEITLETQGNRASTGPIFSTDGSKIAFNSTANNLVSGDTNNSDDVFVKDLTTGVITRVSTDVSGAQGSGDSYLPVFSSDGTKIAFESTARNLVSGTFTGVHRNIFVKDLAAGTVVCITTDTDGEEGNGTSSSAVFSPDGTKVAFFSFASNLVSGDTNGTADVFVKDLATGVVVRLSIGDGWVQSNSFSGVPVFSPDGTKLSFHSSASNLVDGDTNDSSDIFVVNLPDFSAGPDLLNGGDGLDTVSYLRAFAGVTVDLEDGTGASNLGDAAGDTYSSIERFELSNFDDVYVGSDTVGAANWASGLLGDDQFRAGGAGTTNTFHGGAGNNVFVGGQGNTTAFGGANVDTYEAEVGSSAIDVFHAGAGDDHFNGQGGNDVANGFAGIDNFSGGLGNDLLRGGADNDTLNGNEDADTVFGDAGNDELNGGTGLDKLYGGNDDDTLNGNEDKDSLHGQGGVDILDGGDGNDYLDGGLGLDRLTGGNGNDILKGGAGVDTYVFNATDTGFDIVDGFALGVDSMEFVGLTDADVSVAVLGSSSYITIIPTSATIRVLGVMDAALLEADFLFV